MSEVETEPTRTVTQRVVTRGRALVSYGLFAVGLVLLASFFTTHVGVGPTLPDGLLPTVAAPTEQQGRYVDVAPLVAGVVSASVAVWLR